MKKLLMSVAVMMCLNANAQWINKSVKNDFDEPYRICYTESSNSNYLKLENVDGEISLYMKGGYYCDENPTIDLAFIVKGISKKYSVYGTISSSSEAVFIVDNLLSNSDMLLDFKTCSTLKVRLNDSVCGTETYSFNMAGSTSAINFITTK
jgi:hypothetical protein